MSAHVDHGTFGNDRFGVLVALLDRQTALIEELQTLRRTPAAR